MNILTFDIEDWFHILDNDATRGEREWEGFPSRIHANTDRILDELERGGRKATFFCLGWVARRYPEIVRAIDGRGHEIGSHSAMHQLVYEQGAKEFRRDLRDSIAVLEDTIGGKVQSYRAPGFSITEHTPWAFEALCEAGIQRDSSVFPAPRAHGGFASFGAAEPVVIECGGMRLKEFPINVATVLGRGLIFSGGGYFRLLPYALISRLMSASPYVMTYFHPRDFDPGQPVLDSLPLTRRFKSYVGLRTAWRKLARLLDEFPCVDLRTADEAVDWGKVRVVGV
jgi:polysaccharide deacetylase family protein (PEP-CTERM system associated)